jgi:hypothetical protein
MDDRTKRNILVAAAICASLLLIAFRFGFTPTAIVATQTVDGEVVSVELNARSGQRGEAIVRLGTGETVRAVVPSACFVVPGQMARLAPLDGGLLGRSGYLVRNAWDKK